MPAGPEPALQGRGAGAGAGACGAGAAASGAGAAGAGAAAWGAGWAGATTFWPGSGRTPDVVRMLTASETTSAATPMMKTAANRLPTSLNGLRPSSSASSATASVEDGLVG